MKIDKLRADATNRLRLGRALVSLVFAARNPMIGRCNMRIVGTVRAWHMAADAVVASLPRHADIHCQAAPVIGMALQAAISVVGHLIIGCRQHVRIMARDTPEAAVTRAEATAGVHLLGLTGELIFRRSRPRHED